MEYEIIELDEFLVAGLAKRTTNQNLQAISDIGELWGKFINEGHLNSIGAKTDNKTIGLYTDYEKDYSAPYTFFACCQISNEQNIFPPLQVKKIPARKYAKFSIQGHIQKAVGEAWQKIWAMPLERKYTFDFEVYHNNSNDEANQLIDIYIAIK